MTFPARAEDAASWPYYPGTDEAVVYGEGLGMGYRAVDSGTSPRPLFPFGFGLSYASFRLGEPAVSGHDVTVPVTNTGDRAGREVVQLYARLGGRGFRELKAFASVEAGPGQTVPAVLDVPGRPAAPVGRRGLAARARPRRGLDRHVVRRRGPSVQDRAPMRFFTRRLGFYLVTVWAALTINFLIPRMMPGNPVQSLIGRYQGQDAEAAVAGLEKTFGLNSHEGLLGQYWYYLDQLAHGNLGLSITYYPSTVGSEISHSLPWTIGLVGISTVLSFLLGTWAGILAGWRRGSRISDSMVPVGTFLSSMPYFWIGLLALTVFGVTLHWFPLAGGANPDVTVGWNGAFLSSAFTHAVLPAGTIIVSSVGGWLLTMRNMTVTTMAEDYITVAVAKGLSPRRIMYQYAARNALLPNLSAFALSLGFVVSGSIVTETVFSYPGIGFELFNAVANDDYPLMQGIFLVITLAVLVANLLADILYVGLDPRIRLAGTR